MNEEINIWKWKLMCNSQLSRTDINNINYFGGVMYCKYHVRRIELKFVTNRSF